MKNKNENPGPDLDILLNRCTDRQSVHWQQSWNVFFEHYKKFIYQIAWKRCHKWSVKRMHNQLSEEINDIVALVVEKLVDNNFKILRDFKTRDNHSLFLTYLATITDRITKRYIQQNFKRSMFQLDNDMLPLYNSKTRIEDEWECYDEMISTLRSIYNKNKPKTDCDIHLFMMYSWHDTPAEVITSHPFYREYNTDSLYALKNRIKEKYKKKCQDF